MNLQLEGSVCVYCVCVVFSTSAVGRREAACRKSNDPIGGILYNTMGDYLLLQFYNIMNHQPRDGCVYVHMSLTREGQL